MTAARWIKAAPAAALALGVVLLVHGLVPGLVNTATWNYLFEGDMRCLEHMGAEAFTSWCDAYGMPLGYPFLTGGPIVFLGWIWMETTGMRSDAAYLVAGSAFDVLALAGGYGLLRKLGARPVVALVGAVAYLISPTVVGMRDFGGTFSGIALLPAFALVDLLVIQAFERGGGRRTAAAAAAYAAVKTFALFLDGYSFVLSALVSSALWLWWFARAGLPLRGRMPGATAMLAGHIAAVAAYRLYAPPIAGPDPIGVFRSMGLDVATLVRPSEYVWSADLLGVTWDHSVLWGDGTNATYNHVGVACAVLAAVAAVTRRGQPHVIAMAAAGVVALGLSLGPSLKVSDVRGPLAERPTSASYLMPEGRAAADLPWARVFSVPGVAQMRATYRWSAVTRLALIVLAALAIDRLLATPRRRFLAGAATVLALVELTPNVPLLVSEYRDHHSSHDALEAAVVGDLDAATHRGESVFFLSPDGVHIDYLVNYLAATAQVKAFNAGGDKNSAFAQTGWPRPITALARPDTGSAEVARALDSGVVDVIIAPYFHLRWAVYGWPPSESSRRDARRRFAPILERPYVRVRRYQWFAAIRRAR